MKKLLYAFAVLAISCTSHDKLPTAWEQEWNNPTNDNRPMQIIHGISVKGPQGIDQVLKPFDSSQIGQTMEYYKSMGLGGVVCNVNFKDYLKSEAKWQDLINGIQSCSKLGLNVWIYDEDGYPSGLAGGIVLEQHPEYEAQELAYDSTAKDPFTFRDAYEFTHATSNVYKVRRQVNIIEKDAIPLFIKLTHDEYFKRLEPLFGNTIQAFFTDEPSLMVHKFMKSPNYSKTIPLIDPLNFKKKILPSVPWCSDMAEMYRSKYNEDIAKDYRSLFTGSTDHDKKVRSQYWSLIAELVEERYYKPISEWCAAHKVASSGHALAEEDFINHVTLEGNLLQDLMQMQIPGLDMLTSRPERVMQWTWMTASFPYSAAIMNGGRRVMTEISDYDEIVNKYGAVKPEQMFATAGWQAAFGVTEFTLYYGISHHPGDTFRTYCTFVGRLNSILKKSMPDPNVLLYYPVNDIMSEYVPAAEPPAYDKQTDRSKKISESFWHNGRKLVQSQVPFCLIDQPNIEKAELKGNELIIHNHHFNKIVIPIETKLSGSVQKKLDEFKNNGGLILNWEHDSARLADLKPAYRLSPSTDSICMGSYIRDGKRIILLVNVSQQDYKGNISAGNIDHWMELKPLDGSMLPVKAESNSIPVVLKALESKLIVEN